MIAASGISEDALARVLLAVGVVIIVARLAGMVARRVRQPPVVGEIIGGILLGPTLLGAFPGELDELLFPVDIRGFLTVIANLGLVIFMFIVGLELDTTLIKGKERLAGAISLTSIALPMALGVLLAVYLHDAHGIVDGKSIKFLPFALFIGASMSITAFPVLARIMLDRGMYRTEIGALTLASAAVDDVLAWALLAIVLAVIETGTFFTIEFPKILGLSVLFAIVMAVVVRPLLAKLVPAYHRAGRLTPNIAAIIIAGFLGSAFVTSEIGIHHILGAFTFGAMMPRREAHAMTLEILERLEQVTLVLLLPVFFVTTGLVVDVRSLQASDMGVLALILLTACAGKFFGASSASYVLGIRPWRRAAAIGTLMNTRGLTELIILTIGREAGVLDDRLFTMLVIMAIATTVITEPALRLFYPDRMLARDVAKAQREALGLPDAYRVFVAVDDPVVAQQAIGWSCDIVGDEQPSEVVLTKLVDMGRTPELGSGTGANIAELTAHLDAMALLEQQVAARGIGARVLTRLTSEPLNDLVAQAGVAEIDVMVVAAARGAEAESMADRLDRLVCVLAPAATQGAHIASHVIADSHPVRLRANESDNGVGAFEIAVRIARSHNATLQVVTTARRQRHWDGIAQRLVELGIECTTHVSDPSHVPTIEVGDGGASVASDRSYPTLGVFAPPELGRSNDDVVNQLLKSQRGISTAPLPTTPATGDSTS